MRIFRGLSPYIMVLCIGCHAFAAEPGTKRIGECMKRASAFMMDTVSTNGGFVWQYSEDLSERWGEVPARDTQIWVQGATNGVGELFLDAFDATDDPAYLGYARRVANAIIWGQHPSGGWHYLIDFDMPGIRRWYDETASRCWGWEEYYHYYGNCTYDNDVTTSSLRFLLHLYMTTLDPAYRAPLLKGLDFVLESQFPNGAWPQRYPLMYEYVKDGYPDYTSYYTFNDGVSRTCILLLVEAWEKLGNGEYLDAARRGMDFYLVSQGPPEQPAWAEQYDHALNPAQARTYEPGAWHSGRTAANIRDLLDFYRITGDRRYLEPVPAALDWLERSAINDDPSARAERAGQSFPYTHAVYYEAGTNRPLYVHRRGSSLDESRYFADYEFGDCPCHVLQVVRLDVPRLRREYMHAASLTPAEARDEHERAKSATKGKVPDPSEIGRLCDTLDSRGAWLTDLTIQNYRDPCDFSGRRTIRGIDTAVFMGNMRTLISWLE